MEALDRAARMGFEDYNPDRMIQAVNALHPLGKERAVQAIRAYLKDKANDQLYGMYWLLRVLFEVSGGQSFPPVRLGQPDIPPPQNASALPRFPIVMVEDIPFLVVRGYALGGFPEPIESHVTYFEKHGQLRPSRLSPPDTLDSIQSRFLDQWRAAYGEAYPQVLTLIQEQISRMQ